MLVLSNAICKSVNTPCEPMSLKIGIVGLPNVGKSTLFQALTRKEVDTSNYPFATIEPNIGIVEVPDERLQALAALSKSKRVIPTIVEFVDIAGLVAGAHEGEGLGNQFLAHIREVDAIAQVVRAFEDERIIHVEGRIAPERDHEIIATELAMADLATVEKALPKAEKEARMGTKESVEYLHNLKALHELLKRGDKVPAALTHTARALSLLSTKPIISIYNVTATDPPSNNNSAELYLNIKLEQELAALTPQEQKEFGIEPRLPNLIRRAYALLGLISFFTTGEDESRAWTISEESRAPRAGRAIHSDFEEKFIRAEVIFWKDLLEAGSFAGAREKGKLRTEGKEYVVKDGDVIEFKI